LLLRSHNTAQGTIESSTLAQQATTLTMAAISLAIIGKNNEPLYMREFDDDAGTTEHESEEHLFGLSHAAKDGKVSRSSIGGFDCSIRHQFILHAALDRFEQLSGPPPGLGWRKPGVSGTDGMFVGLLYPVEEMRVYGTYILVFGYQFRLIKIIKTS
jgi:hypothetical protein